MQKIDVLIVGGGPAGISTWLHLAERAPALAASSVVIEASRFPRDKVCGGGLTFPGQLILDELRIDLCCAAAPAHAVEFRFGEDSQRMAAAHAIDVVRRFAFDDELARIAVDRGLDLRQGESLVRLDLRKKRIVAETDGGEYRARVVVGADGAHSRVRQLSGLANPRQLARLLKIVGPALDPEAVPREEVLFDFSPASRGLQGYFWRFPCIEDEGPATDWGLYDSRIQGERSRADLAALFRAELADRGVTSDAQWLSHPIRRFEPGAPISAPRTILVGDAAGVDPVLGEGIAPSLEYGEVAAQALIEAFEDGDFSMESYREVLMGFRLGNSLQTRCELASELYSGAPGGLARMHDVLSGWIAAGLP